jgi:two-component system, cell cycle sensor histidine kinase and response regulator CckA
MASPNPQFHEATTGAMYRLIVEAVPEGIWVVDRQGRTLFSNRRMAEILGGDFASMTTRSCFDCVFPEDLAEAQRQFARGLAGDRPPFDFRLRRDDGSVVWVSIACMLVRDEAGNELGLLGLFSDISERKRVDDALRASEERLRSLVDAAPVMTWMTGPERQGTYYNVQALTFAGLTTADLVGEGCHQLIHPDDLEPYLAATAAAAEERAPFSAEVRLRRADGEYRWMLVSGVPRMVNGEFHGHINTGVDVSDLKRSYEQRLASQNLESLGVLAAGVAHDFNNLLGAIIVRSESAREDLPSGAPAADDVEQIRRTAIRASQIVSQLMTFAARESAPSDTVDLSVLVREMLDLLKVSISKSAILATDLVPALPPIRANPAELRQVVMNLIINASEALAGKPGTITITTARGSGAGAAPAVRLEVRDTGCGIAPGLKNRIFDPFFTTRFAGRGLGLSTVQGVVRRLEGSIEVESTPGEGTRFLILLPAVSEDHAHEPAVAARDSAVAESAATVLFIEDEPSIRSAVARLLRRKNFQVVEAADGSAAIALLASDPAAIDLVVLDVSLPGMPGTEVFRELRHIKPGIKIILSTAYSRERAESEFGHDGLWGFIRKPYETSELVELLRHTLAGAA